MLTSVRTLSARVLRSPVFWAGIVAVLVVVLGYAGYRTERGGSMSRIDAFFRSLQLFAMDGSFDRPNIPWQLNLARFMAPVLIISATLLLLAAFLRDQYHRVVIALTHRRHVVMVGLTATSAPIAGALQRVGERVVVVAPDPADSRLVGLRALQVRVVPGDPRHEITLRRAGLSRAREVIIDLGDDAANLQALDLVMVEAATQGRVTVHVAIDDLDLWSELNQLTTGRIAEGVVVEVYNDVDRTARHVVDEVLAVAGHRLDRVVVDGDGPLADRIEMHVARRGVASGTGPPAEEDPEAGGPSVVVVHRAAGDAQAIARGLALVRRWPAAQVLVALHGQISDVVLRLAGASDRLHLVAVTPESTAQEFLQASGIEIMARARHDDYLAQESARGHGPADNPSLVPWHQLPDSLKDSNRRFASSVGDTLADLGARLRPLRPGAAEARPGLHIVVEDLEVLARREHDRWMSSLAADGWTFSPAAKNAQARTHPLLVDWTELDEAERQKDRDAILAIPRMLARVGYELEIPRSGASPQVGPTNERPEP